MQNYGPWLLYVLGTPDVDILIMDINAAMLQSNLLFVTFPPRQPDMSSLLIFLFVFRKIGHLYLKSHNLTWGLSRKQAEQHHTIKIRPGYHIIISLH